MANGYNVRLTRPATDYLKATAAVIADSPHEALQKAYAHAQEHDLYWSFSHSGETGEITGALDDVELIPE